MQQVVTSQYTIHRRSAVPVIHLKGRNPKARGGSYRQDRMHPTHKKGGVTAQNTSWDELKVTGWQHRVLQALVRWGAAAGGGRERPPCSREGGRGAASWECWESALQHNRLCSWAKCTQTWEPRAWRASEVLSTAFLWPQGSPSTPRPPLGRHRGFQQEGQPSRASAASTTPDAGRQRGCSHCAPCTAWAAAPALLAWTHQGAKTFLPPQQSAVGLHPASHPATTTQLETQVLVSSLWPSCAQHGKAPLGHSCHFLPLVPTSSCRCVPSSVQALPLCESVSVTTVCSPGCSAGKPESPLSFTRHSTSSASLARLTSKMKGHARAAGPALRCSVPLHLQAAVTASPHTSSSGWGAVGSPPPGQMPLCTPPHRSTAQCSHGEAAQ